MEKKLWSCKIGEVDGVTLPHGADLPMRRAVGAAYRELTGREPEFMFSGWGDKLSESERAVVENREPDRPNPMTLPTSRLREILELAGKATPGPWENGSKPLYCSAGQYGTPEPTPASTIWVEVQPGCKAELQTLNHLLGTTHFRADDASYIAACSPDVISALVSEVIRSREAMRRVAIDLDKQSPLLAMTWESAEALRNALPKDGA